MLGMGPMEIAVILIIALIIFGPGKLPEIGQTVGRAVRDFRSATDDITGDFKQTMNELQETADDFKNTALEFQHEAEATFSEAQDDVMAAAKDLETSTQETVNEVSEGLSLDQADSPATRPSASAEAKIAQARDEYHKADSSNGTEKTAKAKPSAAKKSTTSKKKSASAKSGTATAASKEKSGSTAKKKSASNGDRKQAVKKRKKREPATLVATPSSASKDDPLADLMGVDDGPVVSSRSRRA